VDVTPPSIAGCRLFCHSHQLIVIFNVNSILLLRIASLAKADAIFIAALPMPFDCCFLNF